ncbi:hypothetical protein E3N88_29112 [Mikania micrantha]|uniref:Uncharacterized protein n=1 Tax=Mikania micrantha TaxID=192012 RepID=A0A5N6N201_9ASTR|nr:hypothetical protein E3N88_29112 [Mikania micrantha]
MRRDVRNDYHKKAALSLKGPVTSFVPSWLRLATSLTLWPCRLFLAEAKRLKSALRKVASVGLYVQQNGDLSIERRQTDQRERGPTHYKGIHHKIELHSCLSHIKLTARLKLRNMLTKTSELRVRLVQETTLSPGRRIAPLSSRLIPLIKLGGNVPH